MYYLIYILVSIALLVGFFVLTNYETKTGVRVLAVRRERIDKTVDRIKFIIENVNLGEFLRDEMIHLVTKTGHDIVHLGLIVVRAVERVLTNLVRRLRTKKEIEVAPRETAREFVKTLSDFKGNLKSTHPEITDIN